MSSNLSSNAFQAGPAVNGRPEAKRGHAVAVALELIAIFVAGTQNEHLLENELGKLGKYADLIQAALKTE